MALWAALYVNDTMIGHCVAQRIRGGTLPDDVNTYAASLITAEQNWIGNVEHRYGDGGWALIRAVVEASETRPPEVDAVYVDEIYTARRPKGGPP